jgi:glycosyltransferase involved in cell wall biosynthesis
MTSVLHVITGLGVGGAEAMLVQLAIGLQSRGIDQYVASIRGGDGHVETLTNAGIPVTVLSSNVTRAPFELVRLVRQINPSVLQGWMYHGNVAAALAHCVAPGRRKRKLFWNIRASNILDKQYARVIGWNARLSFLPDLVIANSQAGMDFHVASGFRPRRQMVIPNGIETDKFRPNAARRSAMRRDLGFTDTDVLVASVARVNPMKDFDTLLAAMGALPDVKGLLVGLGTDQLEVPENVTALGLRHDVSDLLLAADIIVSTSAYGEGFSNALAEGMSSGLVPVTTDVGDSAIIVDDTGTVVEPRDPVALANAIDAIAKLPPATIKERGLQARQRIVREFELDRAIERNVEIYGEAVD